MWSGIPLYQCYWKGPARKTGRLHLPMELAIFPSYGWRLDRVAAAKTLCCNRLRENER